MILNTVWMQTWNTCLFCAFVMFTFTENIILKCTLDFFFLFTLFKFTSIRGSQSRLFFSPREQLLCICWFHCRRLLWMTLQLITLHSCYLPDSWRPTSFWGRASKITLHKTSYCLSFLPFNLSHNLGTPLIGNTLNLTGMCQREYRRHLISNRCKIYINVLRIISNKWT